MYGATGTEKFWRITMPQLVPTIAFLLTMNIIAAFKIYTSVYALFNGQAGVGNSATTASVSTSITSSKLLVLQV